MEKPNPSVEGRQLHAVLKKYGRVPVFLLILVVLFLAGSWYGQRKVDPQTSAGSRRILYYVDPMNPAHTSPEPGLAPCGMKMEPVYADDEAQAASSALSPGSVKITPERQQICGVRVATVAKSPWTYTLRTVGKVAVDETRTYQLNAFSDGFIMKVYDNSTGSLVRRDEPLATYFSKDLFTALQAYYYAAYALDNLQQGTQLPGSQRELLEAQKRSAEYNLMNLGMSRQQIKDLIRSKEITQEIILNAPATSFVLARNITPGQKFVSGKELYRLADLSRVWILADLFKNEARYVRPGEKVEVTLAGQDETYMATVSEVLPEFDPATLTLKVRLEMDNPDFTMRPGMFMDVEFPIHIPPSVNVPVDAVMDSGLKKTVFVQRGNGFFEPRRVKTGWRLGGRVEIVEGLEPGEHIVVSGNFLIDSESRMKLAAAGFFGNVVKDPVCGMDLDEGKARSAGRKSEHGGQTYYFCSDACQKKFDQTLGRYAAKPDAKPISPRSGSHHPSPQAPKAQAADETVKDPVCGMAVAKGIAHQAGLTRESQGRTYYFCSDSCLRQFNQSQHQAVKPEAGPAHPAHNQMAGHQSHQAHQKGRSPGQRTKDPVCGLMVASGTAVQAGRTSEYQGKLYYFDTDGCKQRFDKDPQLYLSGSLEATLPLAFPNVPTNPDLLLRLRRDSIRAIPAGKGQALLEDPPQGSQVKPPAPQTPPMQPPAQPSSQPQSQAPQAAAAQPPKASPSPPQPQATPTPHHHPDGGAHQHD